MKNESIGLAVASMVLGIVALVSSCCFYYISLPCSVIGLIMAAVSLNGKRGGKGMAIAGLVTSIIALIPAIITLVMGGALLSSLGL